MNEHSDGMIEGMFMEFEADFGHSRSVSLPLSLLFFF